VSLLDLNNYKSNRDELYTASFVIVRNGRENYQFDSKTGWSFSRLVFSITMFLCPLLDASSYKSHRDDLYTVRFVMFRNGDESRECDPKT